MIIYKITNLVNNKCYIGQTIQSLNERWSKHLTPNSHSIIIKNAIKKYGKENITKEVIFHVFKKEDLDHFEKYFINYFNCVTPNGYNKTEGGETSVRHTEETKKKISQNRKGKLTGENHPMFGKKHSEESLKRMSESHKGHLAWNKGKSTHPNLLAAVIKVTTGRPSYQRKKIRCLNNNIIYDRVTTAAIALNLHAPNISKVLNKKRKSTGKYRFEFVQESDK